MGAMGGEHVAENETEQPTAKSNPTHEAQHQSAFRPIHKPRPSVTAQHIERGRVAKNAARNEETNATTMQIRSVTRSDIDRIVAEEEAVGQRNEGPTHDKQPTGRANNSYKARCLICNEWRPAHRCNKHPDRIRSVCARCHERYMLQRAAQESASSSKAAAAARQQSNMMGRQTHHLDARAAQDTLQRAPKKPTTAEYKRKISKDPDQISVQNLVASQQNQADRDTSNNIDNGTDIRNSAQPD
eukprot:SAG11_NODE_3184_length_2625_cov_10.079572_2_plen_243_part_00